MKKHKITEKKIVAMKANPAELKILSTICKSYGLSSFSEAIRIAITEKYKKILHENGVITPKNHNNPSIAPITAFPQSVEDVMQIAFDNCIMITQEIAEAYFLNRDSADWHNANGNKIRPSGIVSDIKQWVLRSQSMKAHNQRYYGDEPQRTGNYNGNERQQTGMNGNTRYSHSALDDGNYGDNDLSQSSKSMLD